MLGISFIKILFLQRITIYKSCFEPNGSDCYNNGWSIPNSVGDCLGYKFIGRFGDGTQIKQTFTILNARKAIFTFTLGKIDSWDSNDGLYVYSDNVLLGSISYGPDDGTYACYNSMYPEFYVTKSYTIQTKDKETITIKLQGSFDEPTDNESWGIRRVQLDLEDPCVDFFSECNYEGTLWKICAANQTSPTTEIPFTIKSIKILNGITVKMRNPQFLDGNTQTFTTHQPCLTDYQFPKFEYQQ